jgi:hypothetical protein
MKKISLLLFSSLVMILMACPGKDDDKKSEEDIKKENISVAWKVSTLPSSDPQGNFSDDYKSITLTFNTNGEYSLSKPASVKFSSSPANAARGNWKFSTDLKQVILDAGTSNEKILNIESLSATNFIFNFAGVVPPKDSPSGTITYNMVP